MNAVEDLKKLVKGGTLIVGTDRTMKLLRSGKAKRIYLSSNVPASVRTDIERYGSGLDIVTLPIPSDELGVLCKRQHFVSVACLADE